MSRVKKELKEEGNFDWHIKMARIFTPAIEEYEKKQKTDSQKDKESKDE